jgi:periplasmic protein TonB
MNNERVGLIVSIVLHGIAVAVLWSVPDSSTPVLPVAQVIEVTLVTPPAPQPVMPAAPPSPHPAVTSQENVAPGRPASSRPKPAPQKIKPSPVKKTVVLRLPEKPAEDKIEITTAKTMTATAAPAAAKASTSSPQITTAPVFDAAYLKNPPPVYPALARRRGEEGRVLLAVRVSTEGKAEKVTVSQSSGSELLDHAALTAVQAWRFIPAKRGDAAIVAEVIVPVVFQLR